MLLCVSLLADVIHRWCHRVNTKRSGHGRFTVLHKCQTIRACKKSPAVTRKSSLLLSWSNEKEKEELNIKVIRNYALKVGDSCGVQTAPLAFRVTVPRGLLPQ